MSLIPHKRPLPQEKLGPPPPFTTVGEASDILLLALARRIAVRHRAPETVVLAHARLAGLGKEVRA